MAIEWQRLDCMLCGSHDGRRAGSIEWRGNELSYEICTRCGLKYMTPRPTAAWYRTFYEREFWEDKFENRDWRPDGASWPLWQWLKRGFSGRLRKGRKRARQVVPLIAEYAPLEHGARVLDIGCAFGLILEQLKREYGCDPYGIEPSRVAQNYARRSSGVTLIGTSAEELAQLSGYDGFFNLVIMSNVLENIVDPLPVLEACRRVLAADGLLYVETPNFFHYDAMNPYHPYIFSPLTLSALLGRAGLETVTSVYKSAVGASAADSHVERTQRTKFITVFARPADAAQPPAGHVDVDRLLALQRANLVAGAS